MVLVKSTIKMTNDTPEKDGLRIDRWGMMKHFHQSMINFFPLYLLDVMQSNLGWCSFSVSTLKDIKTNTVKGRTAVK